MTAQPARAQFVETSAGRVPVAAIAPPLTSTASAASAKPAAVVMSAGPVKSRVERLCAGALDWLTAGIPPLIVLCMLLLIWELASSDPKASLPPPSKIWSEASDLIVD